MTNIWMLSKRSVKGTDLLDVVMEVLYALEQYSSADSLSEKAALQEKFHLGQSLLQKLSYAAKSQHMKSNTDVFLFRIVEGLETELGLRPSELATRLDKCISELSENHVSSEVTDIFGKISNIVMNLTSKSVDELSTSLH